MRPTAQNSQPRTLSVKNHSDGEDIERNCTDVLNVVRLALADAKLQWHGRPSNGAVGLPPDVLGYCFEWLDMHDRVRAACVARSWRTAALMHVRLWNSVMALDSGSWIKVVARRVCGKNEVRMLVEGL